MTIQKRSARIHGKRILCNVSQIPKLKIPYDELLITAPTINGDKMRRIVDISNKLVKDLRLYLQ